MNLKKLKPQTLALLTTLSVTLAAVNGCGFAKNIQENVVVRDTVIVTKERKLVDTLVLQNWDTITTVKDNVRVRLVRVNDTIFVDAECPTDTFVVNTVTIKNVKEEKNKRGYEFYLGWAFAILAMLVIIKTVLNKVLE
jgi:hypothetical protein